MFFPFLLILSLFLSHCLYTSHSYNTGRILKQGLSSTTLGYGKQTLLSLECDGIGENGESWGSLVREDDKVHCRSIVGNQPGDTTYFNPRVKKQKIPDWSFGYSLGIRDKWGPFPGLEMGFLLEVPTLPISAEFYLRLGLPHPKWKGFKHGAALGYIMGAWADNSQYLEYAISRDIGNHLAYTNFRTTYMASQIPDIYSGNKNSEFKLNKNRRLLLQNTFGFMWNIPPIIMFPDFVTPQINVTYPNLPLSYNEKAFGYEEGGLYVKWNIGFGWKF